MAPVRSSVGSGVEAVLPAAGGKLTPGERAVFALVGVAQLLVGRLRIEPLDRPHVWQPLRLETQDET